MLADSPTDPRAGIEERYTSAISATDLRVESHKHKPVDEIIAAGWGPVHLGAALLRLHSEWDGAQRPLKPTEDAVRQLAASYKREPLTINREPNPHAGLVREERKEHKNDAVREVRYRLPLELAREQVAAWYQHELGMLMHELKQLPQVRDQVVLWCATEGITGGVWQREQHTVEDKVAQVLTWWLHHTCPMCDGQKWELIPGTRHCSNRTCKACHGSGRLEQPQGRHGRAILEFLDDCAAAARADIKVRFQSQHQAKQRKP